MKKSIFFTALLASVLSSSITALTCSASVNYALLSGHWGVVKYEAATVKAMHEEKGYTAQETADMGKLAELYGAK